MSRPSRKHHFVPQAQLRHFAADADRRFLFVFDKRTGRSFRTSILNAGSENGFNTVETARGRWNFEHLFQEVDTRSARLVGEIASQRSLASLTADDHVALADLFATQLLRTHFSRMTPRHVAGQLREAMRQVGYDPNADPNLAAPEEASLRIGAVKAFLGRHGHLPALLRLVPALYESAGGSRFVISDHPVGRTSAFPYGDTGLASPGVLVTMPVAPDLTVALHCPTIVARYELAADLDLEQERKERIAEVAAETGILRAEFYEDGRIRRGMGQAMIERFGELGEGWFRVVHRDPALRALGKRLDGETDIGLRAPS